MTADTNSFVNARAAGRPGASSRETSRPARTVLEVLTTLGRRAARRNHERALGAAPSD